MLFRVLGPVEVDGTEAVSYIGARKPRALLATLLLKANVWVSVDELVEAIWSDQQPPASAERNVGTYIWQLRKLLPSLRDGGARIESRSGAYRIRVEAGEVDTDQFEALLASGITALGSGAAAIAIERLEAAVSLWRGEPFEGLASAAGQPQVARLVELHWTVRERLVDAFHAAGRLPEAIALATSLTVEDPLRESAWIRLLVSLRDAGRKADALAAYRRARAVLVEELGIEPGTELQRLHHELLAEPSSVPASAGPPADYLRTALEAAGVLIRQRPSASFPDAAAALAWLSAEASEGLTAAIGYFLANGQVASAWQLCSAGHEYLEAGGRLDNWASLLLRVAAATRTSGDRYGELVVRNALGIAYTRDGRLPDACTEFTTALGLAAATSDRDAEGIVLVNLALAEAEFGAPDDAATHLVRALPMLTDPAAAALARQALAALGQVGESAAAAS